MIEQGDQNERLVPEPEWADSNSKLDKVSADMSEGDKNDESRSASWGFKPFWLLATVISVPLVATIFWSIGVYFFDSQMKLLRYLQFAAVLTVVVAGGYQLYFWVQRNRFRRRAVCLKIGFDDRIPFVPQWIWLYSFLYYFMIGITIMSFQDLTEGIHIIFGGLLLLVTGCAIFYFYPTYVPHEFRRFEVNSLSTRYLSFVQSIDNERNAFPSMHCALAAYVGLVIVDLPMFGIWISSLYVVFIVVSCLLVKQHVIADTIAGVVLGAVVFEFNEMLPVWLA